MKISYKNANKYFRRQEAIDGPAAKHHCSESRAIMTTQAVTPASAAAGLGLLMHPNMLMMHQMSAMASHAAGFSSAMASPQMQMLQQMQQQLQHPHLPAAALPPTSSAAAFSKNFLQNTPNLTSSISSASLAPASRQSPSQIVPTNPLINTTRMALDSIGAQSSNNQDSSFEENQENPQITEITEVENNENESNIQAQSYKHCRLYTFYLTFGGIHMINVSRIFLEF